MKLLRFAQYKAYVDYGRSLTSYFNELFLIFGTWSVFQSKSVWLLLGIVGSYALMCFIVGWVAFKYGFKDAETEVNNQYNLFVRQMRRKVRLSKKLK